MKNSDDKCIFCQLESEDVVITENGYTGKQCAACGLIYISPRPNQEDVVDLYGHDNAHIPADDHIGSGFLKRLYAKHHLKIIKKHVEKGSILDIGAGAGNFLVMARDSGFSPYGIEFNPKQAVHIRESHKIPCEERAVSSGMFDGEEFDVIFHCDVISHMFDPVADFKAMHEIMRDKALLVFETGNLGDVDHRYFKYYDRFQYPDHLFFFSTKNLEDLLDQTGFKLIKIHRYEIINHMRYVSAVNSLGRWVKTAVSKNKNAETQPIQTAKPDVESVLPKKSSSGIKSYLLNVYKMGIYTIRYGVGKIMPKFDRPQTLIVVARKK